MYTYVCQSYSIMNEGLENLKNDMIIDDYNQSL